MIVHYCDVCQRLIKEGESKYVLGINPVKQRNENEEENEIKDMATYIENYQKKYALVQTFEICQECKNILEYLFKTRKEERQFLLKKIEKIYNKKGGNEKNIIERGEG